MSISRDRDGTIYEISMYQLPPPLSDANSNRLFYALKEAHEVINDLLERVYQLEKIRMEELLSSVPKPSVEYPYRNSSND